MIITIISKDRDVRTVEELGLKKGDAVIVVDNKLQQKLYLENGWNHGLEVVAANCSGTALVRNFMIDYAGKRDNVQLDDDIKGMFRLSHDGKSLEKISNAEIFTFFKEAFEICRKNNTKLWGVYPIKNHFFMSHRIDPAGFCIGSCCGIIPSEIRARKESDLKEDYDLTLQHILKYKKVARFNHLCLDAIHYTNKGGCQGFRNETREKAAVDYLISEYPTMVRLNPKRKNEILIRVKGKMK